MDGASYVMAARLFARIKTPTKINNPMIHLIKRTILLLLAAVLVAIAGVGCHTASGFGKDLQDAGKGIENGTK